MSNKSWLDLWASFLNNEKLNSSRAPLDTLLKLCEALAKIKPPRVRPYADRLESRRLVCITAMDLGIDLPAIKYNGKPAMARSLLDAWNKAYAEKYGSNVGTSGVREAIRRDVVTRLSKETE